ncbi:hypothetical protein ACFT7S_16235 [Streptomyces sp. NPDC057136]|uniref:hypothetical protein n=1 Tax=Streptomyces sp. NPDC057136 TaxID=3346029 RepID=UPI00362AC5DD
MTREIPWVGEVPSDLEALAAVPGRPHHYIAVASAGTAHDIIVAHGRATLRGDPVVLPGRRGGDNYESFAQKSVVRAAALNVGAYRMAFGPVTSRQEFAVPYPNQDLKILGNGTVMVSSASDSNVDEGPFSSAVHVAGRLSVNRADMAVLTLRKTPDLKPLRHCTKQHDRRIEAIAFLPDRQALWGTDDENKGGSVKFNCVNRVNRVNP